MDPSNSSQVIDIRDRTRQINDPNYFQGQKPPDQKHSNQVTNSNELLEECFPNLETRQKEPSARALSQSATQMDHEIVVLSAEKAQVDLRLKMIISLKIEDLEPKCQDPNDELRDWISYNQSLKIRKKVVENAYFNLGEGELLYMSHKDRHPSKSKWCLDNEDVLFNDDYFEKEFGEECYHELLIELERQRIRNRHAKLDRLTEKAQELFGADQYMPVIYSQLNTQQHDQMHPSQSEEALDLKDLQQKINQNILNFKAKISRKRGNTVSRKEMQTLKTDDPAQYKNESQICHLRDQDGILHPINEIQKGSQESFMNKFAAMNLDLGNDLTQSIQPKVHKKKPKINKPKPAPQESFTISQLETDAEIKQIPKEQNNQQHQNFAAFQNQNQGQIQSRAPAKNSVQPKRFSFDTKVQPPHPPKQQPFRVQSKNVEKNDDEESIEDEAGPHIAKFVQSQGSNASMRSGKSKTQTQQSIRFRPPSSQQTQQSIRLQQPISQQNDAHMNTQSSHVLSVRGDVSMQVQSQIGYDFSQKYNPRRSVFCKK